MRKILFVIIIFLTGCRVNDIFDKDTETIKTIIKWENGEVFYTYQNKESFNKNLVIKIERAMGEWENGTTIYFTEVKEKNDYSYVYTIKLENDSDICYSSLGQKVDAKMRIGLKTGQPSRRVITHELGHCLGLTHEHQRADRDDYIIINWENIIAGFEYCFEINHNNLYDEMLIEYNVLSIMHFNGTTLSIAINKQTIQFINPTLRMYDPDPKESDLDKINLIYKGVIK